MSGKNARPTFGLRRVPAVTKQAEREYPLKVDPFLLYQKPYYDPIALREFGVAVQVLQQHVPRGGRILDLGCGPGWSSIFLARAGWTVVGVDISERMIEIARERAAQEGVDVAFAVADLEDFDLGERPFEGALVFDALHHCSGYKRVLACTARHLKPGGAFLVMEPSWLHLISPHAREATRVYGVTELGFTRLGLRRSLRRAGFRRVSFYHDSGPPYQGLAGFLMANVRLWSSYLFCYPRIKQIALGLK
jgi:SAM-dependent methyltransferase